MTSNGWATMALTLLAIGCGKKDPSKPDEVKQGAQVAKSDFEQFEDEVYTHARALEASDKTFDLEDKYEMIYIGHTIVVGRKPVAMLAELASKRDAIGAAIADNALHVSADNPTVMLAVDSEPAASVVDALRLVASRRAAGHKVILSRYVHGGSPVVKPLCEVMLADHVTVAANQVNLSVLSDPTHVFLGLSNIHESTVVPNSAGHPDLVKLANRLKEEKASAFFADRSDLELAITAGTGADVVGLIGDACQAGFTTIALVPATQLTTQPSL